MNDVAAFLARAIAQGRGRFRADLVLKGGRDLRSRLRRAQDRRRRDLRRPHRRDAGRLSRLRRDRRLRQDRRSRLHRHASARRIVADHAARIRPLRAAARRHDGDLRPARDRQRARRRRHAVFPRRLAGDGARPEGAIVELRAGDPSRDRRRGARDRRSAAARRPPQGARPRRIHEFPRPARRRPGVPRQARRLPGPADRRPCAAAARPRSQRLSRRRRAHRPRDDQSARGAGEARQGHADPGARGFGVEGPARAGADHHRAQFALHRLLHRRPQSARHRRGRPPRLHHPHRDRARRAAARRLSRRQHFRRAHFWPARPRPRRAGLARRPRRARRSRNLRGVAGHFGGARWSTTRCSPGGRRSRRSGATA